MNDLDSELTSETRALLDLARGGDGLPKAHRAALGRRIAGALGLAVPLAFSTSAAASAAIWVVRAVAVIGTVGVVHVAARGVLAPPPAYPSVPASHSAPTALPHANARFPPPPPPAQAEEPPPVAMPVATVPSSALAPAAALRRPSRSAPAPATPAAAVDPLAVEVAMVAEARAADEAGQGSRALAVLDEHDRRFARGVLAPEAAALRVEALCTAGRSDDARGEAARFAVRYPGSPLARRFAATCAGR